MRILYIAMARIPTERAHGLQIMKMCESFATLGNEVELLVPEPTDGIKQDAFEYYDVDRTFTITRANARDFKPYDRIGFWIHRITFVLSALGIIRKSRADLVYTRDEFIAYLLSFGKRPYVLEIHEGRWNFLMRRAIRHATLVPVLTRGLVAYFTERDVDPNKLVVAPDAVDLEDFAHPESREEARGRLGLPLDKKVAMYIGRIDDWKGTDTLFEASALLPTEIQTVVIGGETKQVETLRATYPRVTFLGFRPYSELANNQAAADLLVLPNSAKHPISFRDTSPLKLFTYMTSGVPILASDLPSIREVLSEENAFFFKPDDPQDLARALRGALHDSEQAARLALSAREKVRSFTWDQRARSILAAVAP